MGIEKSMSVSLKIGTFTKNKVVLNVEAPHIQSTDSLVAREQKRSAAWRWLDAFGIVAAIVIVVILTLLPVIFFYLPRVSQLPRKRHLNR